MSGDQTSRPTETQEAGEHSDRREGYIDVLATTGVFGWAWNPDAPADKIDLEVRDGDRVLGRIRADEARQDLQTAGFGDGALGFSFYYDETTTPSDPEAVTVVFADTGTPLHRPNASEMVTAVAQRVENSARFATRAAQALAKRCERLEQQLADHKERVDKTEQAMSQLEVFVTRIDETLRAKESELRKEIAKTGRGGRLRRFAGEILRVGVAAGVAVAVVQFL